MKYYKRIEGDRIYLSPRNAEDYEIFAEWLNDPQVADYIGRSGKIMTNQGEKEFLEQNNNPEATFSIIDINNDKIVHKEKKAIFHYFTSTEEDEFSFVSLVPLE